MANMRLRLRIHRHELPAVITLWPISDIQLKHTVAQLISQINDVFPLEGEQWGLEDYTVLVGGYELLHYHEIGAVCRDEDEVVIRPLQYAERRARTLTGRDQITADGRHLVDGIAYGKPALRAPVRPDVRIPPRKKQRLLGPDDGDVEQDEQEHGALEWTLDLAQRALVPFGGPDGSEDEDEEDDEDFTLDGEPHETSSSGDSSSSEDSSDDSSDDSGDDRNSVSCSDTSGSTPSDTSDGESEDSSSEESWDGFTDVPPVLTPKKSSREINSALPNNTHDEDSNELTESSKPNNRAGQRSRKRKAVLAQLTQAQDSESPTTIPPSKKLKTTSQPSLKPEAQPSQQPAKVAKPHQGQKKTKERNARRRDQKQLKHLKEVNVLPHGAGLKELKEWREANKRWSKPVGPAVTASSDEDEDEDTDGDIEADSGTDAAAHVNAAETGAGEDTTSTETLDHLPADEPEVAPVQVRKTVQNPPKAPDFEEHRQKLLDSIASGGIDITSHKSAKKPTVHRAVESQEDEAPETMSSKEIDALAAGFQSASQLDAYTMNDANVGMAFVKAQANVKAQTNANAREQNESAKATDMVPASVARRSKLDLAGSKRLLFGSLGVRVPKTLEEKDVLQKKFADKAKRPTSSGGPNALTATQANDVPPPSANAQQANDEDGDWRSKLDVTAVECCDEGVTLSTPPFPFHQRWDRQYRKKKNRKLGAYMNNKQRGSKRTADQVEDYDKYFEDGYGDALDYDDVEDDGYWEEGALLNGKEENGEAATQQLLDETAGAVDNDGFPTLPKDVSVLATLAEVDAQEGDYVAYKELAVSAATDWQPGLLIRTVQLEGKSDGGWTVMLALRDLEPRKYDEDGNRVYSKFEMGGISDGEEEDEERSKTMQWEEMVEPRLLFRPSSAEK